MLQRDPGPIDVMFVLETLLPGGTERSTLEIARAAPGVRASVVQLLPGDALRPAFEAAGIPVHDLSGIHRHDAPGLFRALRRVIRSVRPDLVHTALLRPDLLGRLAALSAGVPVVSSFVYAEYGDEHRAGLTGSLRAKNRLAQVFDGLTARACAGFIANSESVRRSHTRGLRLDPERVEVIYRGRDPARFRVAPAAAAARRAELDVPPDGELVTMVGRLIDVKRQDDLLDAVARLAPTRPKLHLWLVGEGQDRPHLEARIRSEGLVDRIRLLGRRDDIPELLAASDVFVSTSRCEGHPGAVVEAMMAGLPVVASDIAMHAETIEHGRTGLLFPLGDAAALASALSDVFDDRERARAVGDAARRQADARFDVRRIAEAHSRFYRRILGLSPSGSGAPA